MGDALGAPYARDQEYGAQVARGPVIDYAARVRHEPGSYSGGSELFLIQASAILNEPDNWQAGTADRLRRWVLQGARVGLTTKAAVVRLQSGRDWTTSGIRRGPQRCGGLMRSAAAALACGRDPMLAARAAREACTITHSWEEATAAAELLGFTVASLVLDDECHPFDAVSDGLGLCAETEVGRRTARALELADSGAEDTAAIGELGRGPYLPEVLPASIYFAVKYADDFPTTISHIVWRTSNGETDCAAFLAGLIAGAATGTVGIPSPWLSGLRRREVLQRAALKLHVSPPLAVHGVLGGADDD